MMKMQMLKCGGRQEDILDGIIPSTLMSGLKRENSHKKIGSTLIKSYVTEDMSYCLLSMVLFLTLSQCQL